MRVLSDRDEPGLLGRTFDWIRARIAHQEELAWLRNTDVALMASDLGLAEADLRAILPRAADNRVLMERMLRARGVDPDAVRHGFPALVRDLELACTRCPATARCRRALDSGVAADQCHDFCANAATIDDLRDIGGEPLVTLPRPG